MKQTYINPKTLIVNIQVQRQLMAGSVGTPDADGKRSVSVSGDSFTGGDAIMSRKGNSWDDEE